MEGRDSTSSVYIRVWAVLFRMYTRHGGDQRCLVLLPRATSTPQKFVGAFQFSILSDGARLNDLQNILDGRNPELVSLNNMYDFHPQHHFTLDPRISKVVLFPQGLPFSNKDIEEKMPTQQTRAWSARSAKSREGHRLFHLNNHTSSENIFLLEPNAIGPGGDLVPLESGTPFIAILFKKTHRKNIQSAVPKKQPNLSF